MDLSTWDFDLHLLDQASLSKHVAYESVDRFVTHTQMCQNVSLSVSRAHCHKMIKLRPPPSHLSLLIFPIWLAITNDQVCRYFQQDGRLWEPKACPHACLEQARSVHDRDTFGFEYHTWNTGCFQIQCISQLRILRTIVWRFPPESSRLCEQTPRLLTKSHLFLGLHRICWIYVIQQDRFNQAFP